MGSQTFFNRATRMVALGAALAATLGTTACTRTSPFSSATNSAAAQPGPLTPAPLPPVSEGQLPPATGNTGIAPPPTPDQLPQANEAIRPSLDSSAQDNSVRVASATPADAGQPVTTSALVGAWTVAVGGGACQIFMSTTKWSGGNRAAVKGCGSTPISSVQAWNLRGKQVVLVDKSGSTAATLYRSSNERFDGSTSSGQAISFSR